MKEITVRIYLPELFPPEPPVYGLGQIIEADGDVRLVVGISSSRLSDGTFEWSYMCEKLYLESDEFGEAGIKPITGV